MLRQGSSEGGLIETLERSLTRRLVSFEASIEQAWDFSTEVIDRGFEREQKLTQEEKGAFLETLVEFVEADLTALRVPEVALKEAMDTMNQNGCEEFAVEFAEQTTFATGLRLVDAQTGFQLFEKQFDLPSQAIERIGDGCGQ